NSAAFTAPEELGHGWTGWTKSPAPKLLSKLANAVQQPNEATGKNFPEQNQTVTAASEDVGHFVQIGQGEPTRWQELAALPCPDGMEPKCWERIREGALRVC